MTAPVLLSFPSELTSATLNEVLGNAGNPATTWRNDPPPLLVLDLSTLHWAEYGAIAQLLLIAEGACRAGTRLQVDVPQSSRQSTSARADGANRLRGDCLRFMRATGFTTAIRMPHLPAADVDIRGLDAGTGATSDRIVEPAAEARLGTRLVPFRWVPPDEGERLRRSEAMAALTAGLGATGLPQREIRLIIDAVLQELVENVALHAADGQEPRPYALIGAVLSDRRGAEWNPDPPASDAIAGSPDKSSSLQIRIVVGDSGVGLAARLAPYLPSTSTTAAERHTPAGAEMTTTARTVLWALTRWSTSNPPDVGTRRGTHGLWRVQRAVRRHGGSALIRTADVLAGHKFRSGDGSDAVHSDGLIPLPGTLVDVTMLSQTPRTAVPVGEPVGDTGVAFRWLRVGDTDDTSLAAAYRLADEHRDMILTVDGGGKSRSVPHESLVEILATAAELSTPSVVVVLVAGVDPIALEAAVDALHHQPPASGQAEASSDIGDPFLLIDETGRSRWCGGAPSRRGLLDELLEHTSLVVEVARRRYGGELRRLMDDQPRLVARVGDSIQLRFHPSDAVAQLRRQAEDLLRVAVDRSGNGVARGRYRTPSLRLTDRWIDVEILLDATIGTATVGFLLVQELARTSTALLDDIDVIQVGPVNLSVLQTMMESGGLRGAVHVMADEFSGPSDVERMRLGTHVVLCTDILLTDNSIRRALAEVLSRGAIPVAIVVPLDVRPDDRPIEIFGKVVPVIRLVRVEYASVDGDDPDIVDIDPILRAPSPKRSHRDDSPHTWDPDEFLATFADLPQVIGLGHVERLAHGHFTAYLDAGSIIDTSSPVRERIAKIMVAAVVDWLQQDDPAVGAGEQGKAIEPNIIVWHTEVAGDYAGRLASVLAGRLTQRLETRGAVRTFSVRRAVAGSRWAFPEALEPLPAGQDVVLVDWGSVDTTTMGQLIRLAAEAGARRVFGVVLLSQMHPHEERALTMIRAVAGASGSSVQTRVRFLTGLGISGMRRDTCSLCQLASQLQNDADDGRLPIQVAEHVRRLAQLLRPISREEAVRREADIFGVPVTTREAIEYVSLRTRLVAGLRSTSRSQEVADHFVHLVGGADDKARHAAVRLLAAERQWLKLPPLRFTECRANVAQLALDVAVDQNLAERLRLQALSVLVAAGPESLDIHFHRLWSASRDSRELLLDLIYQLHRLIRRRPGDIPLPLPALRRRIVECQEAEAAAADDQSDEMGWLLTTLLFAVDRASVELSDLSIQESWAALRQHYIFLLRQHCDAEAAMTRILLQMEEPLGEPHGLGERSWRVLWRAWKTIEGFLQAHVLPFLPPLSRVLTGAFAEEQFAPADRARLERLASTDAVRELGELSSQLQELRVGGTLDHGWTTSCSSLVNRLDELHRIVLASGADATGPAVLASFVEACPTSLMRALRRCVAETRRRQLPVEIEVAPAPAEVLVFCHEELVQNAIAQLIDNVVTPRHRLPGSVGKRVELQISLRVTDREVVVTFRNTGTRAATSRGKGISSMQRKLRDFDADLIPVDPPAGWTYEIRMRLQRWLPTRREGKTV